MKKSLLLSLILLSGVLLTACGKTEEQNVEQDVQPVENSIEVSVEDQQVAEVYDCATTIQRYLDGSDKNGQWEAVKEWDNITVDYIGRLEDGTVFDTSIESVAKACGVYAAERNYNQWLSFQAWAGQMIKWFDNWVMGMRVGQTKTVQFWPEEWYGEYDESLIVTAPTSEVWDMSYFNEWDTVYVWMGYPAKILKITDTEVIFDMNSELAGKSLIFDITVKSIN